MREINSKYRLARIKLPTFNLVSATRRLFMVMTEKLLLRQHTIGKRATPDTCADPAKKDLKLF
jgi:hypothetical protein